MTARSYSWTTWVLDGFNVSFKLLTTWVVIVVQQYNHLDTAPDGDGEGDEDEEVGDEGDDGGHAAVVLQVWCQHGLGRDKPGAELTIQFLNKSFWHQIPCEHCVMPKTFPLRWVVATYIVWILGSAIGRPECILPRHVVRSNRISLCHFGLGRMEVIQERKCDKILIFSACSQKSRCHENQQNSSWNFESVRRNLLPVKNWEQREISVIPILLY